MKFFAIAASALLLATTAASTADDPIKVRQALMDANAAAAGLAGGMMQGKMDFNPAVAKAAILTLNAVALSYGEFFPEGSIGGNTAASPKIFEDKVAWEAALTKFKTDAAAAVVAVGRDGPADLDALKAAAGPVFGNCGSCHQAFRLKR